MSPATFSYHSSGNVWSEQTINYNLIGSQILDLSIKVSLVALAVFSAFGPLSLAVWFWGSLAIAALSQLNLAFDILHFLKKVDSYCIQLKVN